MAISKRFFDIFMASFLLIVLAGVLALVAMVVKMTSQGKVLYWSKRIGKDNSVFLMPKFRTMLTDKPVVATHLLTNPDAYLTPVGKFLRTTSLDELTPGSIGWAQVNGREELSIPVKVQLDKVYFQKQSWFFDLQILLLTFVKVMRREGVVH